MTFIPVAVVLLLLCPVFLGASTSAQLEEIDSVIIHEADMKDIGKFFGSKLIFLKKLTFYVEGSHKLINAMYFCVCLSTATKQCQSLAYQAVVHVNWLPSRFLTVKCSKPFQVI